MEKFVLLCTNRLTDSNAVLRVTLSDAISILSGPSARIMILFVFAVPYGSITVKTFPIFASAGGRYNVLGENRVSTETTAEEI
jgi:hypothetical protein